MIKAVFRRVDGPIKAALAAAVLTIAGCSGLSAPTAQSIAGLSPSGSVTITEDFVAGLGGGTGTLYYQGQTYPFRLAGSVFGPGGVSNISASGEVYKLASVAEFPGRYTQSTGAAGLSTSGGSDLWLQNTAGVIEYRGDAHSRSRRDLYPDGSVIRAVTGRTGGPGTRKSSTGIIDIGTGLPFDFAPAQTSEEPRMIQKLLALFPRSHGLQGRPRLGSIASHRPLPESGRRACEPANRFGPCRCCTAGRRTEAGQRDGVGVAMVQGDAGRSDRPLAIRARLPRPGDGWRS